MGLLERLAPHLPYMRRYARALTGEQAAGDAYVRASLEALAAGERSLPAHLTPRAAVRNVLPLRCRFTQYGAPGRTRTSNPQIRSLVLYPIELRAPRQRRRFSPQGAGVQ